MTEVARKRRPQPPDYKPAAGKKPKGGGMWILLGMILSMGGSGGYYLFQEYRNRIAAPPNIPIAPLPIPSPEPQTPEVIPAAKAPKKTLAPPPIAPVNTSEPTAIKTSTPPPTSFDFYKLLPEMQVGIPPEVAPNSPQPVKPAPKQLTKDATSKSGKNAPAPENAIYMLQAGAFHTPQEADKLHARLAFLGLESRIQVAEKWHRVRLGPFRDFQQATQVQQRLEKNGFATILTRETNGAITPRP